MLNETITVFNYHEASGKWFPSIIHGTDVDSIYAAQATTTAGTTNTGGVEIIIPCLPGKTVKTTDGKKTYAGAKAYKSSAAPAGLITFAPECDFVFLGAWPSTEPLDDEDYDDGLYHEMNRTHDDVYMIHTATYFDLLPHFEIGGA